MIQINEKQFTFTLEDYAGVMGALADEITKSENEGDGWESLTEEQKEMGKYC